MDPLIVTSLFFGLITAFTFGIQDVIVKAKVRLAEPRPMLFAWMLIGLPLALIAALIFDPKLPVAWLSDYSYLFSILGAVCGAVAYDHYYRGVIKCRVSVMASLNSLSAVILNITIILMYSEKVTPQIIAAFILASVGTALSVLSEHRSAKRERRGFPELAFLKYSIIGFAISGFSCIYVLKHVGPYWEFAIDRGMFLIVLGAMYLPILKKSIASKEFHKLPFGLIAAIAALGVVGVLSENNGLVVGLPALVIPLSSSGAAFTTLFGIFAFKEKLSWQQKVGLLMVAGAVVVAAI